MGTFVRGSTVNVASGDGRREIVVASGAGMRATVNVYDLSGAAPRLVDSISPFGGSALQVYSGRIDDRIDQLLLATNPFGNTLKKNGPLSAVGLDLDGNAFVDQVAAGQGLGGNPGIMRQVSTTGAILSQRTLPASPLRLSAFNNRPLSTSATNRFAALVAANGSGTITAKQAAFAAIASTLSAVNADGTRWSPR